MLDTILLSRDLDTCDPKEARALLEELVGKPCIALSNKVSRMALGVGTVIRLIGKEAEARPA
jgi:hypothetical protein